MTGKRKWTKTRVEEAIERGGEFGSIAFALRECRQRAAGIDAARAEAEERANLAERQVRSLYHEHKLMKQRLAEMESKV